MIHNIIDKVEDRKYQKRDPYRCGIMVHRLGMDLIEGITLSVDAEELCRIFLGEILGWEKVAATTGRQNPYSFYVEPDGRKVQALPLDEVGWHAQSKSRYFIGIALIGDFRVKPPTPAQLISTVELCAELRVSLGDREVVGHSEVIGSHDGSKSKGRRYECPGRFLNLDNLRESVDIKTDQIRNTLLCDFQITTSRPAITLT